MWKVSLLVPGVDEPNSVITANPDGEVNRFLFKDPKANIRVEFEGELRREYKDGVLTADNIEYPKKLKSVEDYADALTFMAYVGERRDYMQDIAGSTKKQRDRIIRRRLDQLQKHTEQKVAWK